MYDVRIFIFTAKEPEKSSLKKKRNMYAKNEQRQQQQQHHKNTNIGINNEEKNMLM